jgi:hypothetical protein
MAKSDLLAVAFTDLNGNDKYNPGKDTLIAALVDTNKDGIVSVGDTIQWGAYPAIPDGSASGIGGNFTILESTITDVVHADSTAVIVETALGRVHWLASQDKQEFLTEPLGIGRVESHLVDSINFPTLADSIQTDPTAGGAGRPNTIIDVSTLQPGDQAFLDVKIFELI